MGKKSNKELRGTKKRSDYGIPDDIKKLMKEIRDSEEGKERQSNQRKWQRDRY